MVESLLATGFWLAPPIAIVSALALAIMAWRARVVNYPMLEDHTSILGRGLFESPMIRAFDEIEHDVDVIGELTFVRDVNSPGQDGLRLSARWKHGERSVNLEVETLRRSSTKARVELKVAPLGDALAQLSLHFGGAGVCNAVQSQRLAHALRNMISPPSTTALYLSCVEPRERLYDELDKQIEAGWQIDIRHDQLRFTYPSLTENRLSHSFDVRFPRTIEILLDWLENARLSPQAVEDALEDALEREPSAPIALLALDHMLSKRQEPGTRDTILERAHAHRLHEVQWEALLQAPESLPREKALGRFRQAVSAISATEGLRHTRALVTHFPDDTDAAAILCDLAVEHVLPELRHEVAAALTQWFPDTLDDVVTSMQARQTLSTWVLESSFDPNMLMSWLPLSEGTKIGFAMLVRVWSVTEMSNADLEALTQRTTKVWEEHTERALFTELLAQWETYKPSRRTLLRTFADPEALETFYLEQLSDPDAHQRLIALRGLRGIGSGKTLTELRIWSKGLFVSPEHKREAAQTIATIERRAHVGGLSVSGVARPSGALELTQSSGDLEIVEGP